MNFTADVNEDKVRTLCLIVIGLIIILPFFLGPKRKD